jgi:FKBP-type peptidyl-prolyl cis-trans isomerase FkpA
MNKQWMVLGLVAIASVAGCKGGLRGRRGGGGRAAAPVSSGPLTSDADRTIYAIGALEGMRMREFALTPREVALVERGMRDQLLGGRTLVNPRELIPQIQNLAEERARAASADTRRRGAEFATRAAGEQGATRLPSGLVYRDVQVGTGPSPSASDTVTVHYRGTLIDGTEFDSSIARREPATFSLSGVIPCWTEGVQRMRVGGKARLVCPPEIAYGDRAQRVIPAGSTLDFEVELISIAPRPSEAGDGGAANP